VKKVINDNNALVLSAAKLTHYYTKEEMDKLLEIKSDFDHEHEDYATKDYVNNIASGGEIDFADYAKKSYVDAMDATKADKAHIHEQYALVNHEHNYISEIPEEYITEEELEFKGYVNRDQALEIFAQKSELPTLDGYATEPWVLEQIGDIPDMDLSDYATKDYVNNVVAGGEIDLSDYATVDYVDSELTNKAELYHTHSQYSLNTHTHDDLIAKDAELLDMINTKSNMADVYTKEEIDFLRDNKRVVYLTCEEFNALPDEDRVLEDVVYILTDMDEIYASKEYVGNKRIIYLTCEEFNALPDEDRVLEDVTYILTDMEEIYASKEYVDNKDNMLQANIDAIIVDINTKANAADVYTKAEIDANLTQTINTSFAELEAALDAVILAAEPAPEVPTDPEPDPDKPESEGGDN
jgi:hypothetical protein